MALTSFSSNDSILHPLLPPPMYCFTTRPSSFSFTAFYIFNILFLLPFYILILCLGLQRWWQQHSTSAATMTSHSDTFTYHMVIMELSGVIGQTLVFCGVYTNHVNLLIAGPIFWSLAFYGESFFDILTCVERYLAVVHPITYLSLRNERGIRIRNISIGCVWLFCIGLTYPGNLIIDMCLLSFSLIVVAFCSLSVLYVLIRPRPGEQGRDRDRAHQAKRRAFNTIMAILGALLLRCFAGMIWAAFNEFMQNQCAMTTFDIWLDIPSRLVLPLLFLHRAGRLECCKKTQNEDGD